MDKSISSHINVKRAYDRPEKSDGRRILVDRVWPRGVAKNCAALDVWLKDIAPSTALRKWFDHDPKRWQMFRRRYFRELDENPESVSNLRSEIHGRAVTLVYAAKNEKFNNAIALREYLERSHGKNR